MKLTATVTKEGDRYFAQCVEVDRLGDGASESEALANLKRALDEYYRQVPGVAPPPSPSIEPIEIVVVTRGA